MSHIIGTGRYARETYPQSAGGGGSGALVRVGYDGTTEEFDIVPPGLSSYLPRNAALDPMQVTFPAFTFGNTLEVDFKLNGFWDSETTGLESISTQVVVSVNGGVTFYTLVPSGSLSKADVDTNNIVFLRSLDAIVIVNPMPVVLSGVPSTVPVTAPPIVRVVYSFGGVDGLLTVNGAGDLVDPELNLPGAILKCSELAASAVFQGPLGQLATT